MEKRLRAQKILWQILSKWTGRSTEFETIEFLRTLPFFKELSFWQLRRLSDTLFERHYEAGEYVFEQDQPGAALFIVTEGSIEIEIHEGGRKNILAKLEAGHFFGELALLDDSPRSASARALKKTKTLALYRTDLNQMIQSDPHASSLIFKALATLVGDRLKKTNDLLQTSHLEAA